MKKEKIIRKIEELENKYAKSSNNLLENLIDLTKTKDLIWSKIFYYYESTNKDILAIFTKYIEEKIGEGLVIIKNQSYYSSFDSYCNFCLTFRDLENNKKLIIVGFVENTDNGIIELRPSEKELISRLYNVINFLTDDEENTPKELEDKLAAITSINNFLSEG